jgi:mannosylglycerate hydrolase
VDGATSFPRRAFLVSHTHWDREWYLTRHEFRVDLVRVMKRVLDALEQDPDFRHFVLDGQTVILEDHLEVCPEDEPRIRRLVEAGRLSLGPWYVLPDEFLVSGEATVRNLQIGHAVAARLGRAQTVGYMPDSFGHIAQMPQILRRAGLDSFVYTRGNGDEIDDLGLEYQWQAPDGSTVIAIHQMHGYCNAGGLGFAELWHAHTPREVDLQRAVERVRELFEAMRERSNADVVLLNNGCDHFPPQRDFGRILAALRAAFPHTEFVHGSLEDYVEVVRSRNAATKSFAGELRSGKLHPILSGVWSTRMPLKQRNDRAQSLLANLLEPLSSAVHFLHGLDYPAGEIDAAWKLLLKNHPHDSICGCSSDAVHAENETRLAAVIQTVEHLIRRQMQQLVPTFARRAEGDRDTVLGVFNGLPFARTEIVERLVVLQPFDYDLDRLRLVDEHGRTVPMEIVDRWFLERFWGVDYRVSLWGEEQLERLRLYLAQFGPRMIQTGKDVQAADCFLHVRFLAEDLPAIGHRRYRLMEGDPADAPAATGASAATGTPAATGGRAAPVAGVWSVAPATIENAQVAVTLHEDGSFDLVEKSTGRRLEGLGRLESTEDTGDEYDYSPASHTRSVSPERTAVTVEIVDASGLQASLQTRFEFALPGGLTPDRTARRTETVRCPTCVRLTLRANDPLVQIDLEIENRAEDHRLRLDFPTAIAADSLVSDGQFLQIRRPLDLPDGSDWVQPPTGTLPQQDFSLVSDGTRGVAVFNHGLPEIAVRRDAAGYVTLQITLLRCVGWLSRDDFETRRCTNAGPTLPTPQAQCHGRHRFRLAILAFDGDPIDAGIHHQAQRLKTPLAVVQGVDDGSRAGCGLLVSTPSAARITSIKKHGTRDTLVVRAVNLAPTPTRTRWRLGRPVRSVQEIDLLERDLAAPGDLPGPPASVPVAGTRGSTRIEVELPSHAIGTVAVDLD